jgi:hypothetical protein
MKFINIRNKVLHHLEQQGVRVHQKVAPVTCQLEMNAQLGHVSSGS